jgi:hypothetical protein
MLLSDILVRVASALNITTITASTSPYNTANVLDWITQGVYDFHAWVMGQEAEQVAPMRNLEAFRNYYRRNTTIALTPTTSVPLPPDCYEVWRFTPVLNGGTQILPRYWVDHTGTGASIARFIRFSTTATFTGTVTLIYYRNPEERENLTDEPDMPEVFHGRLVEYVKQQALMATGEMPETVQPFQWMTFVKPPRFSGVGGKT